ncbi:MAG: hypothetical protein Q8O29_13015 [Polaromonas sp.]|uniref:hypothetical protein n=1 Tax=Polaromonas sp. TaxID=1869339 RepID=UPI0027372950|nr:hypothetical protein [Polaromonas sp.]MDP2819162.1 hypothetical protein [Polaromonas sp.]
MKNGAATPVRIRLLGAPGTGKTQLTVELAKALSGGEHPSPLFTIDDNPALPLHRQHPSARTTLLMGLDLPVPPASADVQQAVDRALRDTLAESGVNYQVVYGQGAERLRSALSALPAWLPGAGMAAEGNASRARWIWACDNCSDPQCERRLLSDLLAARTVTP